MKRKIIIPLIVLVVILGITLVGIGFIHKSDDENNKLNIRDWKDRYFYYLESLVELNPIEIGNVGFLDSKISDIPIMYVEEKNTTEKDSNLRLKYYYIEDDTVIYLGSPLYDEISKVELLYNTDKKEYAYYIVGTSNGKKQYDLLEFYLQSWAEYEDKDDFGQTSYSVGENEIIKLNSGVEKYKDDLFINVEVEMIFFKFTKDKDKFRQKLNNYKKQDELITDEVKQIVEDSISNMKENSPSTIEEVSPPVTNSKGLKVGTYTLQYGKYKACFDSTTCYEFVLSEDGTVIFDGEQKYFRIENYNFDQGAYLYQSDQNIYPAIIISDEINGVGRYVYTPYVSSSDCLMTDGELECVNYIG